MPIPNTRVAVIGAPKADRDFDVIDLTRDRLQRLARDLERGCERARRELERTLGRTGRR